MNILNYACCSIPQSPNYLPIVEADGYLYGMNNQMAVYTLVGTTITPAKVGIKSCRCARECFITFVHMFGYICLKL